MSLYAEYLRERTDDMIVEAPNGFATYRYLNEGKTVYIIDIFTIREARKLGSASILADMICEEAKAKGCTELIGTVIPSAHGSTDSLSVLIAYGMTLLRAEQNLIVFRKDL